MRDWRDWRNRDICIRLDEKKKTMQLIIKDHVVAEADLATGTMRVEPGTYSTRIMNNFIGRVFIQVGKICNHDWNAWINNRTRGGKLIEARACVKCNKIEQRPRSKSWWRLV